MANMEPTANQKVFSWKKFAYIGAAAVGLAIVVGGVTVVLPTGVLPGGVLPVACGCEGAPPTLETILGYNNLIVDGTVKEVVGNKVTITVDRIIDRATWDTKLLGGDGSELTFTREMGSEFVVGSRGVWELDNKGVAGGLELVSNMEYSYNDILRVQRGEAWDSAAEFPLTAEQAEAVVQVSWTETDKDRLGATVTVIKVLKASDGVGVGDVFAIRASQQDRWVFPSASPARGEDTARGILYLKKTDAGWEAINKYEPSTADEYQVADYLELMRLAGEADAVVTARWSRAGDKVSLTVVDTLKGKAPYSLDLMAVATAFAGTAGTYPSGKDGEDVFLLKETGGSWELIPYKLEGYSGFEYESAVSVLDPAYVSPYHNGW